MNKSSINKPSSIFALILVLAISCLCLSSCGDVRDMPKTNENTARAEPTQPQPDLPMRTAGNSDTADSEIDELEERRQELKSEYRALIRRQIDHWKGTPDDEAEIDRQFDLLEEKLDALGDDYEKFERSHDGGWKDIVDSIID